MKNQLSKILGLSSYLVILGFLFDFNWILIFRPRPFFSVILGMFILTASQYKKEYTKEDIIASLRWNIIFSSFLTTLVAILSFISSKELSDLAGWGIVESLLPMLYGSIIYLILNILFSGSKKKEINEHPIESALSFQDLMTPAIAQKVFIKFELTSRECHVALKLLENTTNKEIYIQSAEIK